MRRKITNRAEHTNSAACIESLEARKYQIVVDDGLGGGIFDPGNSVPLFPTDEVALLLGTFDGSKIRKTTGAVGAADTVDLFRFQVSSRMKMSIDIRGNTGDVDLVLYDAKHNVVASSGNFGVVGEHIGKTLHAGTYYAAVYYFNADSNYSLRLAQKK